jgi:hypothetical protein
MKKGQIVLVVMLASAIIMTISLAMTKKAVVQTKINTDEELLKQAFNNAESGLEYYKKTKQTEYVSGGQKLAVVVPNPGGDTKEHIGEVLRKNNPEYLWLVGHTSEGAFDGKYYKGNEVTVIVENKDFFGSVKIDLFYIDGGQYKVYRTGYNFDETKKKVNGYTNNKSIKIQMIGQPLLLAATPLFDDTKISFKSETEDLPNQGEKIESTGTKNGVKSVVSVAREFTIPPFLLDAIVAEGGVRVAQDD